ncbi:MAG TPA: HD domain-containing phosphohydrolase, partial [Gammaproteobacteria bacterium]|nr:HD domain-containing phosphohydrolase [Gammaproteobacteria bacterium]
YRDDEGGLRQVASAHAPEVEVAAADHLHPADPDSLVARALREGATQREEEPDEGSCPICGQAFPECRSRIVLPLVMDRTPFGVLAVCSADPHGMDWREVELFEELAGDIAYGVASLRTRTERDQALTAYDELLFQTIETVALTVEKRDPYTAGHQKRVAELAAAMGEELQWSPDRIRGLRLASIIHDLGKIYVPAEILNRPGRLTDQEFSLIQTHPDVGYEIIEGIEFPWPVAEMIRQHHERLDGSGYPKGLAGDAILPEARVLAVADVVEAVTAHRPYRPGRGLDKALEILAEGSGTLFDPEVVDVCSRLFQEGRFRWDEGAGDGPAG